MSEKETGGPAFPQSTKRAVAGLCGSLDRVVEDIWGGMTLRDHFAGLAMNTLLASEYTSEHGLHEGWQRAMAAEAYQVADAMLEARK